MKALLRSDAKLHKTLVSGINMDIAVSSTPIRSLARYTDPGEVILIMLGKLRDFFNFSKTLTEVQMMDITDMVIEQHGGLGLGAVWLTFSMIMRREPPFDERMFESLDGSKILGCLGQMEDLIAKKRENDHLDQAAKTPAASGFDRWGRPKDEVEAAKIHKKAIALAKKMKGEKE